MSQLKRTDPVVFHFRQHDKQERPVEKGGATVVFLPQERKFGVALCSDKDNYNRRVGREIAMTRAMFVPKGTRVGRAVNYPGALEIEDIREQAVNMTRRALLAQRKKMGL